MIQNELSNYRRNRDNSPIVISEVRDSTVFFNSKFESGNLREVEKVSEYEYNLYLAFDFNTLNYT